MIEAKAIFKNQNPKKFGSIDFHNDVQAKSIAKNSGKAKYTKLALNEGKKVQA